MRDNLEELTGILNIELKSITVSEELKLKTLDQLGKDKKIWAHRGFLPITCTIAVCLLMGVIIYPIYNKSNLMNNEAAIMNTSDKNSKSLNKPYIDGATLKEKSKIMEDGSNKIVEESQKEVNKTSKEQNMEKEVVVLNEQPITPFKAQSSMQSEKKDNEITDEDIMVATSRDMINSEKTTKDDNKNNSLVLKQKDSDLDEKEGTKMKTLSLQEAKMMFGNNLKMPSYVPKDFVMEKILVPEVDNNSDKLYEIVYSNNSEYFKIAEYKNTNYNVGLVEDSSLEAKVEEENNGVININKILVEYILDESIENNELPYVKLFWENMGKKYSAEGNAPWAEFINIVSSIIK